MKEENLETEERKGKWIRNVHGQSTSTCKRITIAEQKGAIPTLADQNVCPTVLFSFFLFAGSDVFPSVW